MPDTIQSAQEKHRIAYYRSRPVEWLVDFLGFRKETLVWSVLPEYQGHQWDSTIQFPGDSQPRPCPNPIAAFLQCWAAGYQWIALESATSTGKSFALGNAGLWYLDTHRTSIIRTYAPTAATLEKNMWGYIGVHWPAFKRLHPQAMMTKSDLNVYMEPEAEDRVRWSMTGYLAEVSSGGQVSHGAESAAAAQGGHHKNMTLIVEEATGVDPRIWNALDFTSTGEHNQIIAVGNPDSEHDALHKFWKRESTVKIRVSGLDAPNYVTGREIVDGGFSRVFEQRMLEKYHGNDRHPMYLSRTRGICPRVSGKSLFSQDALESVEKTWRQVDQKEPGQSLSDVPWKPPLLKVEHDPDRWHKPLLDLARSGGWGTDLSPTEELLSNEDFGALEMEGHTKVFELPKYDMLGRYIFGLDVAEDYKDGDEHFAVMLDRIDEKIVAQIKMRGPREAYALAALTLARMYGMPKMRDMEYEKELRSFAAERDKGALAARLYYEEERAVQTTPNRNEWTRGWVYPKMAHESQGVGGLHLLPPFRAYPNLYYGRNPDVRGGKRSRKIGWRTTKGSSGTRMEIVQALDYWGNRLLYYPEMCPSEEVWFQCSMFKKNQDTGKYEAEQGFHDDAVMATGIALCVKADTPAPSEAKKPAPEEPRTRRRIKKPQPAGSIWDGAGTDSVFTQWMRN